MKISSRTLLLGLSLPALLLATGSSYATARLQSVDSAVQASGKSTLRLHFDSKVGMPKSFIMKQPASIVLDFSDAATAMNKRSKQLNSRSVKNIKIASGAKKLRVMVSLRKLTKYTTSIQGNNIILTFEDHIKPAVRPRVVKKQKSVKRQAVASNYVQRPQSQASKYRPTNNKATYRPKANRYGGLLGTVDFRRTQNGAGRTIIDLPSPATAVEARKVGNVVVIDIKNTNVKQSKKRIDVLDFATPASFIDITRKGKDAQVRIMGNIGFTFTTKRNGKQFIVTMKKVKRKIVTNPINKKKHYKGKKLSLNFQDIEVRSVLQLLADFTDKNIVVSDSVKGNITLRLKDIPWDQALDIVLESKGLAMRSNGNVIWVAPATELVAKEQHELQAIKRKQALEPLITEYIVVNYAKADDLLKLIES
ncbi:MAG TPA: AMIN domain-containing protein, partial [Leucothrix sp.]|nr:AMIN domain-containing protein [Leucothrix sp.]